MDRGNVGQVRSRALATVGSLVGIAIHHLGYREFRSPEARPKLAAALLACGIQALAFLLTGNILAPVVAHVVLHSLLIVRGIEMPPIAEPVAIGPLLDAGATS